ncbi:hypothetical protein [Streptomyces humi]|uniref:hypothetical protein n=1 Tax=Streptomyces humi TaxID=1428620 RepID=UPI00062881E2|nr:hypothetical protein [Streptomyces humi]
MTVPPSFFPAVPPSLSPTVPPALRVPRPLGTDAPATCEVPDFEPVRVGGGRYRLTRALRHRGGALAAACLALTAAALVAAGPGAAQDAQDAPDTPHAERTRGHPAARPVRRHAPPVDMVTAPVRIADAATVRLLRPGDRVDVIAAGDPATGRGAAVIARGVRVTGLPEPAAGATESGALVVLSVPRGTAPRLVGASTTARLAVTLC